MSNEHKQLGDYSWLNSLPEWSNLGKKDISKIFGYVTIQSISSAVTKGVFPKPDLKLKTTKGYGAPRVYWTVKTIKEEIKRREKIREIERLAALEGISPMKYLQKMVKL